MVSSHIYAVYLTLCVCVCAVKVRGQPGGHGLLGEGRRTSDPESDGGSERREGGGAGLEGEEGGGSGRVYIVIII